MTYGLEHAYNELKEECDRYGIVVNPRQNLIEYDGAVKIIKDTTTSKLCKQLIRIYIKKAKARRKPNSSKNNQHYSEIRYERIQITSQD